MIREKRLGYLGKMERGTGHLEKNCWMILFKHSNYLRKY